ncbi:hypothetical protein [Helicobacter sp. MIT 14-3879]|uniref:hypothetical protein n=1 Tax=Helicobacter sp. MIT 14-3879 TaxID=2040649 RepID=UPI000E1E73DF|nr:hypothetical protein [Helicobacter sp. MIT 14-3879]RDU64090.1 hypothetical protein CQA44_03960 [Helicobacter sp. MIT 14-3879]
MVFRYYPLAILILGILTGIYVYNLTDVSFAYTLPFSEITYDMPVAIYIVMIIFVFFLLSLVFLFSERLSKFLESKALKNDKKTFVAKIKNRIIERSDEKLVLKTELFKEIDSIFEGLDIAPKPHYANCTNKDIKKLFAMYENLQNGEEIDVYKFNIPQTSTIFTMNIKNSIIKNYKNGLPILKNKNYIYELKKFAFMALLNNADSKEIEKYKDSISYDRDISLALIEAYFNKKVNFNLQELSNICKNAKFSKEDYLFCAKSMKNNSNPSDLIKLFEYLSDNDDLAENAYFYILLELEMLEEVKSRLRTQPNYEFINVRAYLDLKSVGKSYPTDLFFS